jgi:hypothetical protein|tara:strand:- start:166 stop:348 length:183 start_codon:yes stop_codon:yes gene_type:complete
MRRIPPVLEEIRLPLMGAELPKNQWVKISAWIKIADDDGYLVDDLTAIPKEENSPGVQGS